MVLHHSKNKPIAQSKSVILQQGRVKHTIKQAQRVMFDLCNTLSSIEAFDNTVTPDTCIDRLVAHRIKSKFHIDDPAKATDLQEQAFVKYIKYDEGLSDNIIIAPSSPLSKARTFLYELFADIELNVADIRYDVTPGETYISSGGEVSLLAKLFDVNHWTTTANCLEDTCVFIYNNVSFKRVAKQHFGRVTRKEKRNLYLRFRNKPDIGYCVFRYLLIRDVLILVDGARASTVPKSNDQRRFINVEAMFPVILQRAIAHEFLSRLEHAGNDLSNAKVTLTSDISGLGHIERSAQALHGKLISSAHYATIDFSNASDSVTIAAVRALFPKRVVDILLHARSHYVVIDGEFHSPKKLSSMGNGFTFEVMTAMLFAIARSFTTDCRVYGDDVIIPNEFADDFVRTCRLIDFRVNNKKTFIRSFFRESCGYFYSDHVGDYIVSFDFNQIVSLADIIITCNKLTIIIESNQASNDLIDKLKQTRDQLAASVHASRKGPLPPMYNWRKYMALYLYDDGYDKKQRRCKELRTLRQHYIKKNGQYFDRNQMETNDYALIYVPFFVPAQTAHVFTNTRGLDILLPALYSGKRMKHVQKNMNKGRWVDLPAFVHFDGTLTLISNIHRNQEIWVSRLEGVFLNHEKA